MSMHSKRSDEGALNLAGPVPDWKDSLRVRLLPKRTQSASTTSTPKGEPLTDDVAAPGAEVLLGMNSDDPPTARETARAGHQDRVKALLNKRWPGNGSEE